MDLGWRKLTSVHCQQVNTDHFTLAVLLGAQTYNSYKQHSLMWLLFCCVTTNNKANPIFNITVFLHYDLT